MRIKCVGLSFAPSYPENILRLAVELEKGPVAVQLVREPTNEHDPNSVALMVDGAVIGYLPRHYVSSLAPRLDAGERFVAEADEVVIHPDHPGQPGLWVSLRREDANAPSAPATL